MCPACPILLFVSYKDYNVRGVDKMYRCLGFLNFLGQGIFTIKSRI